MMRRWPVGFNTRAEVVEAVEVVKVIEVTSP
jgi:hypothetical protein